MNAVERIVRRIDVFQQTHRPVAIGFGVIKKFGDDRAGSLAALIAYYSFLAIFPLLLLMTTILGFAMETTAICSGWCCDRSSATFRSSASSWSRRSTRCRATRWAVTVGVVGIIWGSLGVTQAGQLAMAEVWNVPGVDRPPFLTRLVRGFGLLGVLGLGLAATTAITSFSAAGGGLLVKVAGLVLPVALNIGLFALAFRVLTVRSVPTRALLPGVVLGGVCWSLLQVLGAYLVGTQLRHASEVYGYFASVLGLVSWLFLGAQLTLYAAEVNVVWARRLWPRSIVQPPLTEADMRAFDHIALQGERRPEQSVVSTWDEDATAGGSES